MLQKPLIQAVLLALAAFVLAVVANAMASRERRLVLPGFYPNAQRVPKRVAPTPVAPAAAQPPVSTTAAESVVEVPVTTSEGTTAAVPVPAPAAAPATTTVSPVIAAPPATKPLADPLARFKPHPDQASLDITGEDAVALHARGVLFLDARRTSVYEEGHIAGARSFPVWESDIDDRVNALYGERSDPEEQNRPIVIYCSGGACEDSHMLAQKLWGIQFNNVYVYKDGFPDWQKRGGAVKTGGQP
jgi:rhodanese-related sulfurtransferase